jgi:hypothetical protein
MNVLIILTTTVYIYDNKYYIYQKDPKERLNIYLKSINQWINTGFNLVIVENSGYTFPEFKETDKLQIISYKEKDIPECSYLLENKSKGASELFAINYAFKNCKFKNQSNFIIKVTGRYFIPYFENYLTSFLTKNCQFEIICQNEPKRCEFLGCSRHSFNRLFNISLEQNDKRICNHIEDLYSERINTFDKVLICKKMQIEPTQHGGIEKINYYL